MEKVHYHNTSDAPVFIGGVSIAPGAARLVDARLVPGAAVAIEEPAAVGSLLDVLDGSVAEVVEALEGLSDDELDALEAAETAGKTRKGVLGGIAEARLRRAAEGDAS